jgi:hypothetical protein
VRKRPELGVLLAESITPLLELPDLRGWNQWVGGMPPKQVPSP